MLNNTALLMMMSVGGQKIKQVACTINSTWFINSKGELYGCGSSYSGQQGNGSKDNVLVFTKRADNVDKVSCSGSVVWYITKSGELYGCGSNLDNREVGLPLT